MVSFDTKQSINSQRLFPLNSQASNPNGDYIVYWMQVNRRLRSNHALDYAVALANHFRKPLVILEAVRVDYPWHSDRFHNFILQGMQEHAHLLKGAGVTYLPFVERFAKHGKGLVKTLSRRACVVVTDLHPCFIFPEQSQKAAAQIEVRLIAVDSNGLVPLKLTDKAPYSAYLYRKIWQKYFRSCLSEAPQPDSLAALQVRKEVTLNDEIFEHWQDASDELSDIRKLISDLPIDHSVCLAKLIGTEDSAHSQLQSFLGNGFLRYASERNHPDANAASGLSPWLHFGKIGIFEILNETFATQGSSWNFDKISKTFAGKSEGWFGGDANLDSFLDELITWREVGLHFCFHRPDFDQFSSLPDWARQTLNDHAKDARETIYLPEQLENGQTHDELWNAAQNELVREGTMQNYLRMLWGKNVISWTQKPQEALTILIHLNNKYALDGRDPNSYSGIFWCFGRFDRPWFERAIFGSVRYMTSDSARKKLKMKNYLARYAK